MRNLVQFVVVAVTVVTLTLGAAIGVSANSGTFGTSHGSTTVAALADHLGLGFLHGDNSGGSNNGQGNNNGHGNNGQGDNGQGNNGRHCGQDEHHGNGTPDKENHPCPDKGRGH
jgi:hypothetical protein